LKTALIPVLSAFALSIVSVLAGGCVAGASNPEEGAVVEPGAAIGHEHMMLTDQARAALPPIKEARATNAHTLTYYGGPVVQNVAVHPVYWNANVANQATITAFYSAVSTGQYMTFLSQYSTTSPAQTIGNGTSSAAYVAGQTSTAVTDAQIQTYLTNAFNAGTLPKPNNNTYYPIHFPSGVSITASDGSKSCVQFCAYHGTGVYGGQDFYYGVLPDVGQSGCAGGCGGSTVINNTTSVASHEFAETVTDPAVGLATVYGPPLAWYNATYGEVGDICNGQQTSVVLADGKTYTVQKEWSNKTSTCAVP